MSDLTKAQRARLGFFLLLAVAALAAAVLAKVGPQLLSRHDTYHTRISGGVGGLQPGAQVTLNGITVGRVGAVALDPLDVALVDLELELAAGTPVAMDATATVAMMGITGLRYVELAGGTKDAKRRAPGDEIPEGHSLLDRLSDRAMAIADKVSEVLASVQAMTGGADGQRIATVVRHVESISATLDRVLVDAEPRLATLLGDAAAASASFGPLAADARATLADVRAGAASLRATAERIGATGIEPLLTRLTQTTQHLDELALHADVALGRLRGELHGAFESLARGVESIGDLADMLRADPTSLVFGRSAAPREEP